MASAGGNGPLPGGCPRTPQPQLLLNARAGIEAAPEVARILAEELGQDKQWIAQQVAAYEKLARGYVFGDPASTEQPGEAY